MAFLITVRAMPDGWVWANLFHHVLQGLVTNEISGKLYSFDLGLDLKPPLLNATNVVVFDRGIDPSDSIPRQVSSLLTLTILAGGGINPSSSIGLLPWVQCNIVNECLWTQLRPISCRAIRFGPFALQFAATTLNF